MKAWETLVVTNPIIAELEPDVEVLLVNRVNHTHEYYRAPIDLCYALSGLIRTKWRGLSGGAEAWRAIDDFFVELNEMRDSAGVSCHG
jgi:hypothetical protein